MFNITQSANESVSCRNVAFHVVKCDMGQFQRNENVYAASFLPASTSVTGKLNKGSSSEDIR